MSKIQVKFHVGGPEFHPVVDQAAMIQEWLGNGYDCSLHHDKEIFDHLEDADLVVFMGLFTAAIGEYSSLEARHEEAFARYVSSGKPLLMHHGAIASYDDSEIFIRLIGINWTWSGEHPSQHSPIGTYRVKINRPDHPLVEGVSDFELFDELYFDLASQPGVDPQVLATAEFEGRELPMVQVIESGRIPGAGRLVYLANGHDLRAFEAPALRQLWINSIRFLT